MPLLGKKVFFLAKPLININPNEIVYEIKQTGEKFRSKDEYEKRLQLYGEKIWTCQCTNQMNLTYEAAMRSEQEAYKRLRKEFPSYFEKPVLELVHHSTASLEQLVEDSYNKLINQLVIGELVQFKVKNAGKSIEGKIIKLLPQKLEGNGHCTSPSSDKENTSESSKEGESQKSSSTKPPPLPYKYNVQLLDQDKIIASVPADDLWRIHSTPSEELLALFINAHALRFGSHANSPWVVEEKLIQKYNLPNKFAEFFVSPHKMAEMSKNAEIKKRKSSSKCCGENKKAKIDHNHMKPIVRVAYMPETDHKYVKKIISSPVKKKSSSCKNKKPSLKNISDSKKSKTSNSSSSKKLKDSSKKKKHTESSKKIQKDKDVKKKKKKKAKNGDLSQKKSESTKSHKKKLESSKKAKHKEDKPKKKKVLKKDDDKKKNSPKKDLSPPKKKAMKQMTLLDMSTKKGKSPNKSKGVSPPKPQPLIVQRIQKALDENRKPAYIQLLAKATRELSEKQRNALPLHIKQAVLQKLEKLEEKKKLKLMTEEEKQAYITNKRLDRLNKAMKERKERLAERRNLRREMLKRYEDKDLDLKALPSPKLVLTPEGIPNEAFGNVTMITEFLSSYAELLTPGDNFQITSEDLMNNLVAGKEGFMYLNRILVILLQTLLQDQIAEDYKELKVPLSDVPVNFYTASELVRLCLRKHDVTDSESTTSSESSILEEIEDVPESLVSLLETAEFFDLEPFQKLELLVGLCHRILSTYSVQDFMEERQQEATKLWKLRIAELKEKNDIKRAEKAKRLEAKKNQLEAKKENEIVKTEQNDKVGLTVPQFYGKIDKIEKELKVELELPPEDDNDLASIVKRRRILSVKAQLERERQEKLEKERREKEAEEIRKQKQKELFDKQYDEGMLKARIALRHGPIGTDRNHNRYWLFSRTCPGLYVEKGWANKDIDYRIEIEVIESKFIKQEVEDSYSSYESASDSDNEEEPQSPSNKKEIETSIPSYSQNLWFVYDQMKEIDELLMSLAQQGVRESRLIAELHKHYSNISKLFNTYVKSTPTESISGEEELLKVFKQELMETETRLAKGGLGGVGNYGEWQTKLNVSSDLKDLASCMIETQKGVGARFLQGVLAPKKVKMKTESTEDNEVPNVEQEPEEEVQSEALLKWHEAVETATTLSRLHVLLGMLDASIKWEKSAENAKCKICRKKGDDSKLLLCDDCNQAFHLYCLRPALLIAPHGDWLCPACQPASARRTSRTRNYKEQDTSDEEDAAEDEDDAEEEECEIQNELECSRCGGDEGLVFCSKCPAAYHKDCHIPPLRNTPRSTWRCCDCVAGRISKAEKRKGTRQKTKKRSYRKQSKSHSKKFNSESRSSKVSKQVVYNEDTKTSSRRQIDNVDVKINSRRLMDDVNTKISSRKSIDNEDEKSNVRRQTEDDDNIRSNSQSNRKRTAVVELSECKNICLDLKSFEVASVLSNSSHSKIISDTNSDEETSDLDLEDFSPESDRPLLLSHCIESPSIISAYDSSINPVKITTTKMDQFESLTRTVQPSLSTTFDSVVGNKDLSVIPNKALPLTLTSEQTISSPHKGVVSCSPNKMASSTIKLYSSLNKSSLDKVDDNKIGQTLLNNTSSVVPLASSNKTIYGSNRQQTASVSDNKICEEILQKLMRSRFSWPFRVPVDKKQYPDYHEVIENPLDFHMIKNKCSCKEYNAAEFISDVQLVLNNARQYPKFKSHAEIQECIIKVEEQFHDLLSKQLSFTSAGTDCAYSNSKIKQ